MAFETVRCTWLREMQLFSSKYITQNPYLRKVLMIDKESLILCILLAHINMVSSPVRTHIIPIL